MYYQWGPIKIGSQYIVYSIHNSNSLRRKRVSVKHNSCIYLIWAGIQPKSSKIGCNLTIPSPSSTGMLQEFKYDITKHISIDFMQHNETNLCVEGVIKERTSRREFSHNPNLGVAWCLHCQIWHFQTSSLVLLPSSCCWLSTMHTHYRYVKQSFLLF